MCHEFRKNLTRAFFTEPERGPQASPKKDEVREKVIALRKRNLSIYDIQRELLEIGKSLSLPSISQILLEEGFSRLPRSKDEERPLHVKPEAASIADVRKFCLAKKSFRTKFGGLFLFLPFLAKIPLDSILGEAGLPGTDMISSGNAIRSLLALKLFGNARHSHIMSNVFDEGLALFAGLNAIPKRSPH